MLTNIIPYFSAPDKSAPKPFDKRRILCYNLNIMAQLADCIDFLNSRMYELEFVEVNIMAKNERFEKVYSQGTVNVTEIWVDKETGINYVFHTSGYAGGLTPLLDSEGKPVISPIISR